MHLPRYRFMLGQLKAARKQAGLTQVEVAKALRQTQAWVSKCENGERRIDVLEMYDFMKLYKKPLKFFIPPDEWNG